MLKSTRMLITELSGYKNPKDKIKRLVRDGKLIPVIRGLYETDNTISPYCLAGCICTPSYISFESALSYYGLIPETVYVCTSASFGKNKRKVYDTPFGVFAYRDIPKAVFPMEVLPKEERGYGYLIASPEKALCDKLFTLSPIENYSALESALFDDLRIDRQVFLKLNYDSIVNIAPLYKSTNLRLLAKYLRR